ncbi:ABC transporter ATP-binding protein [Patescibacteria group bacterium]
MNDTVIKLEDVSREFVIGEKPFKAVKNLSLEVNQGDFIAIMGTSGSGKSTLMNIIGCLDKPTGGRYYFEGKDITHSRGRELVNIRRNKIGFIFQNFNLLPRLTASRNVELPLIYAGVVGGKRHERAYASLERVGLKERVHQLPNKLSGGEQQRVAIARALVNDPTIILADEPTGNLDSKTSNEIMGILSNLNNNGSTIIMVTHDPSIADITHRIISLKDGQIV